MTKNKNIPVDHDNRGWPGQSRTFLIVRHYIELDVGFDYSAMYCFKTGLVPGHPDGTSYCISMVFLKTQTSQNNSQKIIYMMGLTLKKLYYIDSVKQIKTKRSNGKRSSSFSFVCTLLIDDDDTR